MLEIRTFSKDKDDKKFKRYEVVLHRKYQIDEFFAQLEDYLDITEKDIDRIILTVRIKIPHKE